MTTPKPLAIAAFLPKLTPNVLLGCIVIAGTLIALGAIVALHFLPTGYKPVKNAVSDYGVGRYQVGYQIEALFLGVAGFTTFTEALITNSQSALVLITLFLFAGARVLIAFFPTDLEGQPRTSTGKIHSALAAVGFLSVAVAAESFIGSELDSVIGWSVVAATVLFIFALNLKQLRKIFGLIERIFYATVICWFLVVGWEFLLIAH
jgi:hypothetical protein